MCGIAGILHLDGQSINPEILEKMTDAVFHRGPDGYGYTAISSQTGASLNIYNQSLKEHIGSHPSQHFNIGLGHRRLAIIDLTDAANQPMKSQNRNTWITYNGEIYNYIELRQDLQGKGYVFLSSSDTEVILHAYEQWGIDCLGRLEGMFSFSIWDQKNKRLFCARDRLGIKPFYYFFDKNTFIFGSEIKQFFNFSFINRAPNHPLVYDYLMHGFTDHSDQTMYKNIRQLEPGHYLILNLGNPKVDLNLNSYWSLNKNNEINRPTSEIECQNEFFELFSNSVSKHLRSDVQVGSCLSGGIDSSSIVGMVHSHRLQTPHIKNKQMTFTACFNEDSADERPYSNAVIEFTGAANHQLFPDMNQAIDGISQMLAYHDEPFGSSSQYSQWCLFKEIQKTGIKVVLDGQGADEILAGYHSSYGAYFLELMKRIRWLKLFQEIKYSKIHHGYKNKNILKFMASSLAIHLFGMRLGFIRPKPSWLGDAFYQTAKKELDKNYIPLSSKPLSNFLALLIRFNLYGLLRYEDRSSMAHSVEARLPFLDHHLVEFLFNLPCDKKINRGWTKAILRNTMKNIIPEKVRLRKDKMGFVTPEQKWIQKLPDKLLDDLLSSSEVRHSGYFNVENARKTFKSITTGQQPFTFLPWRILNFSIWLLNMKKHNQNQS